MINYISLILTSVFLFYISRPVYKKVYKLTDRKRISVVVALLSFSLPVLLITIYMSYLGFVQLVKFANTESFESIKPALQIGIDSYINLDNVQNISSYESQIQNTNDLGNIWDTVIKSLSSLVKSVSILLRTFISLVIVITLTYYLIKDGSNLKKWLNKKGLDKIEKFEEFYKYFDNEISSIFVGNILAGIVIAAITIVSYLILNLFILPEQVKVPYIALVGLLCGITSLVPVIGIKIVYIPLTISMYFTLYVNNTLELLWAPTIFFFISVIIIDTIPEIIIRPYISSRNTHLGLLILAYIVGPSLFGWYGFFLGPIFLVIASSFSKIILPELIEEYS